LECPASAEQQLVVKIVGAIHESTIVAKERQKKFSLPVEYVMVQAVEMMRAGGENS
jgi:hypothetical protein